MARRKTTRRKTTRRKTVKRRATRRASRKPKAKKTPISKWLFMLGLIGMLLSFAGIYSASTGITIALILWLIAIFMVR